MSNVGAVFLGIPREIQLPLHLSTGGARLHTQNGQGSQHYRCRHRGEGGGGACPSPSVRPSARRTTRTSRRFAPTIWQRFDDVARVLAALDVDTIWQTATEIEHAC
jgi:hypothetical protein